MGAEQFGQGTMLGAVTLSWLARRMLRLLLLRRRFGTATVYSLFRGALEAAGNSEKRGQPRIQGFRLHLRVGEGAGAYAFFRRRQVRTAGVGRDFEQDGLPQETVEHDLLALEGVARGFLR